jgi:crossover junction endodeoxyribonuclease RuvC
LAPKRILGIDPGTATVGFGVVDKLDGDWFRYIASGIISTSKELPSAARLSMIRKDLLSLLEEYKPSVVAVEAIFFFKNAKTIIPVAQAKGVILEASSTAGYSTVEYTPMQVKMCLTGDGKADKKFIQSTVASLLNLSQIIKPDDASDGLAIAICHARMNMAEPHNPAAKSANAMGVVKPSLGEVFSCDPGAGSF